MSSKVIPLVSARNRLLVWGIVMTSIYGVFLFFFPLHPKINQRVAAIWEVLGPC